MISKKNEEKIMMKASLIILTLMFIGNIASAQEFEMNVSTEDEKTFRGYLPETGLTGLENYDIGEAPEGDYPNEVVYSPDGTKIFIVNRLSDNITIVDAASATTLANIPVGSGPVTVAVISDYAVVPCRFSADVYIIDLSDNSIAATIPVNGEPVSAVINGDKAYIGCDTDANFNDECAIIDLTTLTLQNTIVNFPVKILSYTWTFNNGRNLYRYSKFAVTDDGSYVVAGNWVNKINFYNTTTGAIDYSINTGLVKNVSKSGDGSTIVGFSDTDIYQIDVFTHSLTTTVNLGSNQMPFQHLGVANQDGSKAFIALNGNKTAFINFATTSVNIISQTYTPSWISTNADRSKVFSGQKRFTVLDFNSETVLGQNYGVSTNKGAISPISEKAAAIAFSIFEGIFFYDFTNLNNIIISDYTVTGQAPEGDAPMRIKITPNGQKALIINELSHNMMVFDIPSRTFESNINFNGAPKDIEITHDGNWAVISTSYLESEVVIYDIQNELIATEITLGSSLDHIEISSDDSTAYIRDFYNKIYVLNLNGALSSLQAQVSCGMGAYASFGFGTHSSIELTPDDNYLFISCPHDDEIQIMDTHTNSIVGYLPVGTSTYGITFTASGNNA
ncbi:MAG: hypothetical protein KAS18_08370, partial [Calditrichia bacterium]|nr:hypothetical protein [Calditrichia bacterium]